MHYHIVLTELCNSRCNYCFEKSMQDFGNEIENKLKFDMNAPAVSNVPVEKLKKFIAKDKDAVIIFYGGEPLMEIGKIKDIMDAIDVPYRMQTNGKLLHKLPSSHINKIGRILVSLDGNEERTDLNRGKGTYGIVMQNIARIKKNGYNGELIARMVIAFPDVYEQVKHLIDAGFTSIHWQLDAGFYKFDFDAKKFAKFAAEYNASVSRLIDYWTDEMKNGRVLKLYPFLAIMDSLLKDEKSLLRCGAGHSGYAVATDGKIVACPIMNGILDFVAGSIDDEPKDLKKFDVRGRCLECDIKGLCGGRCLYWNKASLWPKEGDDMICSTIRHLIAGLKAKEKEVRRLIEKKVISIADFEHEKYFGPEIIP